MHYMPFRYRGYIPILSTILLISCMEILIQHSRMVRWCLSLALSSVTPSLSFPQFLPSSGIASIGGSSDGSLQYTPEVIVIFYDEDTEEKEIVDLTSEDDEDPEMDIEIILTSDND
ncbi:hypothetical protein AHAS_Ahas01G0294900 [Arachis hypogaea]